MYVSAPKVALRDRVAVVYNKVGFVENGTRLRILGRSSNRRFVQVRTETGQEGWMPVRYLVTSDIYNQFLALARASAHLPAQSKAITRRKLNMHIQPARDAEKLYQLNENEDLELLRRASTPKAGLSAKAATPKIEEEKEARDPEEEEARREQAVQPAAQQAHLEDWWLVRDSHGRVGWVLARMVDVDIPLDIAQYAEGQRIVAAHIINRVQDEEQGKEVPQYVVLLTEPKDGMPFDYNQMRVFTWNTRRHRYETAYRDRFPGKLPFTLATDDFGREGKLPVFIAQKLEDDGSLTERKYKMNGVIVRRITEDTPATKSASSAKGAGAGKSR